MTGRRGEGASGPVGPAPGIDDVLLDVKLSAPRRRSGLASRAALVEAARDAGAPCVGITAPAGYGKSVLLAWWARHESRRVGWVSLDRSDDDAGRLLFLLASAYERAVPERAGLVAATAGTGEAALARAAPRVASALARTPAPFVLFLDDLHELETPACHDVLGVVLAAVPPGSQIVTASRHDQPHLPRLRAAGDAVELTAADLRLDAAAAQRIFATARVDLTAEQAVEVTARTEGWPVGLHLAALLARDARAEDVDGPAPSTGTDAPPPEAAELPVTVQVTGEDRYIADYLHREVLRRLSPDLRSFLRRTSVLDRLTGPLCDAVLEQSGSAGRLRELERASAFLTPVDRRRKWYRHHALFRDFLLGELRRDEPDLVEKLHLRAADWFQAHGSPAVAVEYLLSTSHTDRSAQLVTELVRDACNDGRIAVVQRWLTVLGEAATASYPPLAVHAARVAALTGRGAEAQRWAVVAEQSAFTPAPTDGSASLASTRALMRAEMCREGPERMLADAERAVTAETAASPWRASALCALAEAHLLSADRPGAEAAFGEAAGLARATGDSVALLLSESGLALLAMDDGRWDEAASHTDVAVGVIDRHGLEDYAPSLLAFAAAARLALHRAQPAEADGHLIRAMRARAAATVVLPCVAVRGRLQVAKCHWARGDHVSARHVLREIDDLQRSRPALGALDEEVARFREVTTAATTGPVLPVPLTPAELRLLPYLQTHLKIAEVAERLQVSRNTVATEVSAIYRKLGVASRSEAVHQATLLGLLGG